MTPQIISIEMPCVFCEITSRLKIDSINRRVRCTHCQGEFVASTKPVDVVRVIAGCSVTKKLSRIILQREDGLYRFAKSITASGEGNAVAHTVSCVDVAQFDFHRMVCDCGNRLLHHCDCGTVICTGGATETPEGSLNRCPSCHRDSVFNIPVKEVRIFDKPLLRGVRESTANAGRLALSAATSLMKWGSR